MCDTLIALSDATADGSVLFAKNSDREPNEAHELAILPAADHLPGSRVRCTYLEIPQAAHTHALLLAKPAWIWGAEMGANERGVVIGNEAVFTRVPVQKDGGLTGMDLLRLALERASDARAALGVITALVAEHGQGGSCGFSHPFYYHNSFLIGDPREAWVLETAGKEWAAVQVKRVGSISNQLTIGSQWDLASDGLVRYAVDRGWCKNRDDFDFARCYSDTLYTTFSAARYRRACSVARLQAGAGSLTVAGMMRALRDHGPQASTAWDPANGLTGAEVCMHAGFGPVRINQTTGSMVSRLGADGQTHWLTGTAAPCSAIFKPVWIDAGLPAELPRPGAAADADSLWWRHEALHRALLVGYPERLALYREERDRLENGWIAAEADCRKAAPAERQAFTEACFRESDEALARWTASVRVAPAPKRQFSLYSIAWRAFDRQAGLLTH
ncbi:MAG TPA: C69 family dipeptidase [Anaerolineaceae bacterium]|jgi:dipeptidase